MKFYILLFCLFHVAIAGNNGSWEELLSSLPNPLESVGETLAQSANNLTSCCARTNAVKDVSNSIKGVVQTTGKIVDVALSLQETTSQELISALPAALDSAFCLVMSIVPIFGVEFIEDSYVRLISNFRDVLTGLVSEFKSYGGVSLVEEVAMCLNYLMTFLSYIVLIVSGSIEANFQIVLDAVDLSHNTIIVAYSVQTIILLLSNLTLSLIATETQPIPNNLSNLIQSIDIALHVSNSITKDIFEYVIENGSLVGSDIGYYKSSTLDIFEQLSQQLSRISSKIVVNQYAAIKGLITSTFAKLALTYDNFLLITQLNVPVAKSMQCSSDVITSLSLTNVAKMQYNIGELSDTLLSITKYYPDSGLSASVDVLSEIISNIITVVESTNIRLDLTDLLGPLFNDLNLVAISYEAMEGPMKISLLHESFNIQQNLQKLLCLLGPGGSSKSFIQTITDLASDIASVISTFSILCHVAITFIDQSHMFDYDLSRTNEEIIILLILLLDINLVIVEISLATVAAISSAISESTQTIIDSILCAIDDVHQIAITLNELISGAEAEKTLPRMGLVGNATNILSSKLKKIVHQFSASLNEFIDLAHTTTGLNGIFVAVTQVNQAFGIIYKYMNTIGL